MQLKRDTDYALRVMHCLKTAGESDAQSDRQRLTLSEIALRTSIPRIMAGRICSRLHAKGMIALCCDREGGELVYHMESGPLQYTLLDVVNIMEGTSRLFAVFDPRTSMYRGCENVLNEVQNEFEKLMVAISLEKLFEKRE